MELAETNDKNNRLGFDMGVAEGKSGNYRGPDEVCIK